MDNLPPWIDSWTTDVLNKFQQKNYGKRKTIKLKYAIYFL